MFKERERYETYKWLGGSIDGSSVCDCLEKRAQKGVYFSGAAGGLVSRDYRRLYTATATRTSKSNWLRLEKKTLPMHHAFLYISVPLLHDYDVNCLISRFIDNANIRRRISLTLLNLDIFLKNSTPGEFAYIKHCDRVGVNRAKVS